MWDGERGWVQDWGQGQEVHWFEGQAKTYREAERHAWHQRKLKTHAAQEERWKNGVAAAHELLQSCRTKEHNYLHSKGLGGLKGLVDAGGALVAPMRNVLSNVLQGAQRIV